MSHRHWPVRSLDMLSRAAVTRFVSFGLLAIVAVPAAGRDQPTPDVSKGPRIFITGHSFHMPIAQPLGQIAAAAGISGTKIVGKQGIGGSTVSQHWDRDDASNLAKTPLTAGEVVLLNMAPTHV